MKNIFITDKANFFAFIKKLQTESRVYAPSKNGEHLHWKNIQDMDKPDDITPNYYRALNPLKSFLFPVKEEVTKEPAPQKTILIGAKACDLEHLKTMDSIFLNGVVADPYYASKRKELIIISADCDAYKPSCFCTKMGNKPYPETGYDINISVIGDTYIFDAATETGLALIQGSKEYFSACPDELLAKRDGLRAQMARNIDENNKDFTWANPGETVENNFADKKWEEDIAATCVECDACRFNCGTCYCFLLDDIKNTWDKNRTWDSCQSTGYARVAGGANPRKTKGERLRNFYMCKLSYRPANFGFLACTGCGRCIEVCQGKIDIRKSLQKLSEKTDK